MSDSNKKACAICKCKITAKVFWQKYCSQRCRVLAWAKKKLKEIEKEEV